MSILNQADVLFTHLAKTVFRDEEGAKKDSLRKQFIEGFRQGHEQAQHLGKSIPLHSVQKLGSLAKYLESYLNAHKSMDDFGWALGFVTGVMEFRKVDLVRFWERNFRQVPAQLENKPECRAFFQEKLDDWKARMQEDPGDLQQSEAHVYNEIMRV